MKKILSSFIIFILAFFLTSCNKLGHDVCLIEFDGNGGTLVNGIETQYLKRGSIVNPPVYTKELYEFIGFDKEVSIVNEDTKYTALYEKLTIKDISPMEVINNIRFGFNYIGLLQENNDDDKLFDTLIESGINAIQLSQCFLRYTDNDDMIKSEDIKKLKDTCDLAISKGMYVIITTYDSYEFCWSSLHYKNIDRIKNYMNKFVKQIIDEFKDYDEHLMFSFLGEPRDYRDNGITESSMQILNEMNELFVKMVRESGGNNRYRNILITTGWGSYKGINYDLFKMPKDKHVIVNVHCYKPFGFVHDATMDEVSFDKKEKEYKIELLSELNEIYTKFIKNGIPVLITEFGIRDKHNEDDRIKWLEYYVSCAKSFNLKCFIWDSNNEHLNRDYSFSVIDKMNCNWKFPKFIDRLKDMLVNNNYINFYNEINNLKIELRDKIVLPDFLTNRINNEKSDYTFNYDSEYFEKYGNNLYPKKLGTTSFLYIVDGYKYYTNVEIYSNFMLEYSSFALEVKMNNGHLECFILTRGNSIMRRDYDWYSSNEKILRINEYSGITILGDGVVCIKAVNKETKKQGVIELVIKDRKIIKTTNSYKGIN